mgnify:CR=1 FL=1
MHFALAIGTGVVVANPIPADHELPRELYERAIAAAIAEAGQDPLRGRDVTPFLLERLRVLTENRSVCLEPRAASCTTHGSRRTWRRR